MEKKAGKGLTRISARKIRTSRASGFTLLEILIVIALMLIITAILVPNVTMALKMNIQNSGRDLATTIRSTYDDAILTGQVYRLAFDIDKGQYWVERGQPGVLMQNQEQEEESKRQDARLTDEERAKKQKPFTQVTKAFGFGKSGKKTLPTGVKFTDISTPRLKAPITGGMAYAHIFPHGYMEKVVIHLKDSFGRQSTVITNSVNGKSRVFEHFEQEAQ